MAEGHQKQTYLHMYKNATKQTQWKIPKTPAGTHTHRHCPAAAPGRNMPTGYRQKQGREGGSCRNQNSPGHFAFLKESGSTQQKQLQSHHHQHCAAGLGAKFTSSYHKCPGLSRELEETFALLWRALNKLLNRLSGSLHTVWHDDNTQTTHFSII